MNEFNFENEEFETVVLEMDDGTEEEFAIVEEFEMDDKKYVLLALIEDDMISEDPDNLLFMRDTSEENGCEEDEISLEVIESDDEYVKVVEFYTEED